MNYRLFATLIEFYLFMVDLKLDVSSPYAMLVTGDVQTQMNSSILPRQRLPPRLCFIFLLMSLIGKVLSSSRIELSTIRFHMTIKKT
jgi:hypothetical protein